MGVITKKIKGTEDVLPKDSYRWQFVEDVMRKESAAYGFKEIRTPVLSTQSFCKRCGSDNRCCSERNVYIRYKGRRKCYTSSRGYGRRSKSSA